MRMRLWFFGLALLLAPAPALAQVPPSKAEIAAYTGLHAAAAKGDTADLEKLVKAGAALEARDGHQRTPLHVAAHLKRTEAAALLIVNSERLNFVDNPDHAKLLLARIRSMRGRREFFNLAS